MKYVYNLSNDGQYFLDINTINNMTVEIKMCDKETCIFNSNYEIGFWRDNKNLYSLHEFVLNSKIVKTTQEAQLLINSALLELIKTYEPKTIPPGFEIDRGLFSIMEDKDGGIIRKIISHTPVWVTSQYENCDSNEMLLDVAFEYNNSIRTVTIPQKDAFQRRGIMEIASKGVLLEESKTSSMIGWIVDYIHYNDIPINHVFERFGWKDNLRFVTGNKIFSKNDESDAKIINVPQKSIQGLSCFGTIEGWVEMTNKILKYDRARLKCYAACTAPLLKLLNQKSFILHDYGESSTGKTKTSELGMSIWGDPEKLIMSSWGTSVGKERLATLFTDLPILIDETQISSEEDNTTFIYLIANETGKLRGLKEGGLQDTLNWKTVAFTTGEAPLTSEKSFMGMSMRVLEIYGGLGAHDYDAINDFKYGIKNNYGVLAPLIIKEIIDNYNDLSYLFGELNKKFNSLALEYNNSLNGAGGRAASMFAILALGGIIFEEVITKIGGEKKEAANICAEIYREYIDKISTCGYSTRAYNAFISWFATKEKYFLHDMMELGEKVPYDQYGNVHNNVIDIFPNILKEVVEKNGYNYNRVLKDWQDNNTIEMYTDSHGKTHSSHTIKYFNKTRKVKRVRMLDN